MASPDGYTIGTADIYMWCQNSNIMGTWCPNLKADDAIMSSPASDNYNCISWSGGRTDLGFIWPPDPNSPNNHWYDPNPKTAFDKFYGNVGLARFSGAMTYVPTTDANQSVVDLWALSGTYTHASVQKPGDSFMHGYDWESKPGGMMRTFHPRHALAGPSYGDVLNYYKQNGMTMASVPATGKPVVGNVLTSSEPLEASKTARLGALASSGGEEGVSELGLLYSAWRSTWYTPELLSASNPEFFFKSDEFKQLEQYCQSVGKPAAAMLLQRALDGDELAGKAVCRMKLVDPDGSIMERVRNESPYGTITQDGYFVVENAQHGWTRFASAVLDAGF